MKYFARKLGMLVFTLLVSMSINFFLPRLMPGDPAKALMDRMEGVDAEKLESVRAAFGLDTQDSLPVQYGKYLINTINGDFGISLSRFPLPVAGVLAQALPWTIGLMGLCTLFGFTIGTLLGIWAAWRRRSKLASFTVGFFTFIRSFPYFWLGLFLIYLFAFRMRIFPLGGSFSIDTQRWSMAWWVSVLKHGALPAFTITLSSLGGWLLMMRNNMINVLAEEYIQLAVAKGLSMRRIRHMYAARNAILPSVTGFAMSFGFIVGGGLITEMVFAYPGMGYMLYQAVHAKDYPLMQAIFLIIAASVLAANFLADIAIMILDPRVRDGAK